MKKIIFLLLGLLGFQTQVSAQQMNILFIGNSYTHYNNMPKIFERLARSKGKDVYADSIAVSGSTLREHAGRASTYRKLKSRQWDIVVVQGFSRELAQDSSVVATETIPYVKQILDSMFVTSPCANVYFYMTWGYKEGYEFEEVNNTYEKMQARVKRGYTQLHDTFGYPMVPVGLVWNEIRLNHPEINLYKDDNQHPNIGGSFLIANCFYTAFFRESPQGGVFPKSLDSSLVVPLSSTAEQFILANYNTYYLSMIQHPMSLISPFLDFKLTETWTNVQVLNQSKNCTNYFWDFGDGSTSKLENPKHYYKKDGTYTVTLTATKDCHPYVMKKLITVSKTDKFATSNPTKEVVKKKKEKKKTTKK